MDENKKKEYGQRLELIDTQWDVNKTYAKIFEELKAELIDTQWDVNGNAYK